MKHTTTCLFFIFLCPFIYGQDTCDLENLKFFVDSSFLEEHIISDGTLTVCAEEIDLVACYNDCISSNDEYLYRWNINEVLQTMNMPDININESSDIKLTVLEQGGTYNEVCEYSFKVELIPPMNEIEYELNFADIVDGIEVDIDILRVCGENASISMSPLDLRYTWKVNDSSETELDAFILEIDTNIIKNDDMLFISAFSEDGNCSHIDTFIVQLFNPPVISSDVIRPQKCGEIVTIDLSGSEGEFGSLTYQDNTSISQTINNPILSFYSTEDSVKLTMYIENFEVCSSEKTLSVSPDDRVQLVLTGIKEEGYCIDDTIKLKIDNFEQIDTNQLLWHFNDENIDFLNYNYQVDAPLQTIINSLTNIPESDSLFLKITYKDNLSCENEFLDELIILKKPQPQLTTIPASGTICKGDFIEISLNESDNYGSINWFFESDTLFSLNNPNEIVLNTETLNSGDYTYSVSVDLLGCTGNKEGVFKVEEGIVKELNKVIDKLGIDLITVCSGSNNLYSYTGIELKTDDDQNEIVEKFDIAGTSFYLHQWNSEGVLQVQGGTQECTMVEVQPLADLAPVGSIERFGNSTTLVYSDEDGSATKVRYRWFTIDDDEGFKLLDNADKRTIDCKPTADCDLGDSSQRIGLIIIHDNTQCINVFIYNVATDVPVNEYLIQSYFNIYPSLNNGYFRVDLNLNKGDGQLLFYDVNGKEIHTEKTSFQSTKHVNLNSNEAGIYIAVLKLENKIVGHQKFLIH